MTSPETEPASSTSDRPRRAVLMVGLALTMLLLGGAAGMLLAERTDTSVPGADSVDVGGLAFDIAGTQHGQAGAMSGWLDLWGHPELPETGTYMRWMKATGHHGDGGVKAMPGMATRDEIARLRTLTGTELDVYFLQLMLRHHQGGLPMATYAAEHAEHDTVRNLADKIAKAQTHENAVMTAMLTERGAAPLPA